MEELYNYLDKIKNELDNSSVIKEYLKSKDKVMNNKELVELINKYHNTMDENIKSEIIKNEDFLEYKKHENDVNFLILEINKILKDITKKGGHGSCQG